MRRQRSSQRPKSKPLASVQSGKALYPKREFPGPALKAPDVARSNPVGPLIAKGAAELLSAEAEISADFPKLFAGHIPTSGVAT
jgi:hypothetical protein